MLQFVGSARYIGLLRDAPLSNALCSEATATCPDDSFPHGWASRADRTAIGTIAGRLSLAARPRVPGIIAEGAPFRLKVAGAEAIHHWTHRESIDADAAAIRLVACSIVPHLHAWG